MSNRKCRIQDLAHGLNEQGYVDMCSLSNIKINAFQVKGSIQNFRLKRPYKASQQKYDWMWIERRYEY